MPPPIQKVITDAVYLIRGAHRELNSCRCSFNSLFCIPVRFFCYENIAQKLKLNIIHTALPRQQYCVLRGEIKILYNYYKNQESRKFGNF